MEQSTRWTLDRVQLLRLVVVVLLVLTMLQLWWQPPRSRHNFDAIADSAMRPRCAINPNVPAPPPPPPLDELQSVGYAVLTNRQQNIDAEVEAINAMAMTDNHAFPTMSLPVRLPVMRPPPRFGFGYYTLAALNLTYVHTPKSGGSTMLHLLRRAANCSKDFKKKCDGVLQSVEPVFNRPSFAYTFVRHPEGRARSQYDFAEHYRERSKLYSNRVMPSFKTVISSPHPWEPLRLASPMTSEHMIRQVDIVLTNCSNWAVDFIGTLEHYTASWNALENIVRQRVMAATEGDPKGHLASLQVLDRLVAELQHRDVRNADRALKQLPRDVFDQDPELRPILRHGYYADNFVQFAYESRGSSPKNDPGVPGSGVAR